MNDTIKTYDRTRPTPFDGWNKINRAKKDFHNDAKIQRFGKTLNLQEFINENNVDCTIYDVYEKYRGDKKLTQAQLNTLTHRVSEELTEIKDLKSALEVMNKAKQTWDSLPIDIRKEFGNNVSEFQKNGLTWANNKIKAEADRLAAIKAEELKKQELLNKQPIVTEKVNNNG